MPARCAGCWVACCPPGQCALSDQRCALQLASKIEAKLQETLQAEQLQRLQVMSSSPRLDALCSKLAESARGPG